MKRYASKTPLGICFCWEGETSIRVCLWFDQNRYDLKGLKSEDLTPEGRHKTEFISAKISYPITNVAEEIIGIEYILNLG